MSKIKILPEILSNKIAAGEVVERPSSVVKELVENALDAGSTQIIIDVEKGGRSIIRVSDNGSGMNHDDALLAMERYATSKIYKDQDLFSINTLGFRGEALPSIASVSKLLLVTKDKASETGTEIVVEGGKIKRVSEVGAPCGTMVTAKQIFFNTPARRKFLKTVNTEMGHIADTVTSIAVGRPHVRFKLLSNGKMIKNWSAVSDTADRVIDVFGKDLRNDLHPIEFNDGNLSVAGWISSPRIKRSTFRGIYVYVNSRFVRDRIIRHALLEGYAPRLMKGQFPVAALFINVPFDQVDVNVHPTKYEVRFADQKKVYEAVAKSVSDTLHLADQSKWAKSKTFEKVPSQESPYISETVSSYGKPEENRVARPAPSELKTDNLEQDNRSMKPVSGKPAKQVAIWGKNRFSDLRFIGQFHNTYLLCESKEGLITIDQHAAHERILFEQLKKRAADASKSSQKLLLPETIDLGYREAGILEKLIPDLKELGLEIEPFGGNSFVMKSIPALLENREIKPLVIEIVEKIAEIGYAPGLERTIDECLILMACHGAIRANQRLSDAQVKSLLNQLDECDNPSNCPHGRPTWIQWTLSFVEKNFGRIV